MHASVHGLKLITFDADGTLYADGAHMMHDNEMIHHIYTLLQKDEVHPAPSRVVLNLGVGCRFRGWA